MIVELRGVTKKPFPLGGRWPRPRPRPDEGQACRYCPLTNSWFVGNGLDRSAPPCRKHNATGKPRAIRRDFMRCAQPDVRMGQDPSLQTETRQRRRGRTCPARSFPAYARLPYTAGPGMPGPYRTFSLPPPRRGGFFHFYVNFTRSPLARRINILYN